MNRADIVLIGGYAGYELLHGFIGCFARRARYSGAFADALQLTLKEAFVNAIKHGNGERADLTVSCRLIAESSTLLAAVRDCGKGFNPDDCQLPFEPPALFRLSGRGICIIRSIAEIVALHSDSGGSTLTLRYIPW